MLSNQNKFCICQKENLYKSKAKRSNFPTHKFVNNTVYIKKSLMTIYILESKKHAVLCIVNKLAWHNIINDY